MFKYSIVILGLGLSGCITPDKWGPDSHKEMLMQCRVGCGADKMASYDAWSAVCSCRPGS